MPLKMKMQARAVVRQECTTSFQLLDILKVTEEEVDIPKAWTERYPRPNYKSHELLKDDFDRLSLTYYFTSAKFNDPRRRKEHICCREDESVRSFEEVKLFLSHLNFTPGFIEGIDVSTGHVCRMSEEACCAFYKFEPLFEEASAEAIENAPPDPVWVKMLEKKYTSGRIDAKTIGDIGFKTWAKWCGAWLHGRRRGGHYNKGDLNLYLAVKTGRLHPLKLMLHGIRTHQLKNRTGKKKRRMCAALIVAEALCFPMRSGAAPGGHPTLDHASPSEDGSNAGEYTEEDETEDDTEGEQDVEEEMGDELGDEEHENGARQQTPQVVDDERVQRIESLTSNKGGDGSEEEERQSDDLADCYVGDEQIGLDTNFKIRELGAEQLIYRRRLNRRDYRSPQHLQGGNCSTMQFEADFLCNLDTDVNRGPSASALLTDETTEAPTKSAVQNEIENQEATKRAKLKRKDRQYDRDEIIRSIDKLGQDNYRDGYEEGFEDGSAAQLTLVKAKDEENTRLREELDSAKSIAEAGRLQIHDLSNKLVAEGKLATEKAKSAEQALNRLSEEADTAKTTAEARQRQIHDLTSKLAAIEKRAAEKAKNAEQALKLLQQSL